MVGVWRAFLGGASLVAMALSGADGTCPPPGHQPLPAGTPAPRAGPRTARAGRCPQFCAASPPSPPRSAPPRAAVTCGQGSATGGSPVASDGPVGGGAPGQVGGGPTSTRPHLTRACSSWSVEPESVLRWLPRAVRARLGVRQRAERGDVHGRGASV